VPIIFLTAFYNEDQHVVAGYGTGAVDYLHKPVNATVLRSKVAVFVELHRKSRELAMANRALLLEVAERRRAEEQLRELNESLDRRVTERSEALRESEQRFRTMADQTPVMMWVASPAGAVDFVNKEYCSFFGVSTTRRQHSAWRLPAARRRRRLRAGAVRGAAHAAAVPGRRPHAARRRRMALDDVARRAAHVAVGRLPRHDRHEPGRHRTAAGGDDPAADRPGQGRVHRRPRARAAQPARADPTSVGISAPTPRIRWSSVAARSSSGRPRTWRGCSTICWTRRGCRATRSRCSARVAARRRLQAAVEIASPLVEQQRLELVVDGVDEPVWLDADQRALTQVFGNLLNNAAKYSKPAGRVDLIVRPAGWVVGERARRRHRHRADMLERVFEPFTQATMARDPRAGRRGHRPVAGAPPRRDARRRHPGA
jgi:PAS domain-containing protein